MLESPPPVLDDRHVLSRPQATLLALLMVGGVLALVVRFPHQPALPALLGLMLLLSRPQTLSESVRWGVAAVGLAAAAVGAAAVLGGASWVAGGPAVVAVAVCAVLAARLTTAQALARSHAVYGATLNQFIDEVPQLLWSVPHGGHVDFLNRRFADVTGKHQPRSDAIKSWQACNHPDDLPRFMTAWRASQETGAPFSFQFRLRHADGQYRWMLSMARAVRSPSGALLRWYGGTVDIHDLTLVQAELETLKTEMDEASQRFGALWNEPRLAFAEQDISEALPLLDRLRAEGVTDLPSHLAAHPELRDACVKAVRVVGVNQALATLMGYASVPELLAKPASAANSDGASVILTQLNAVFQGRDSHVEDMVLTGKGGMRVPVSFHFTRASPHRLISSLVDISEREQVRELRVAVQDELARANRVATMGAFSASLAHELNQPITAIKMEADAAQRWLRRDTPNIEAALKSAERVVSNANRADAVLRQSRERVIRLPRAPERLDVCALALETRALLADDLRIRGASLQVTCAEPALHVVADRVEVQQVMINLVINAADAMRDQPAEARQIFLHADRSGPQGVRVAVSDVGPGLPAEHVARLFDAFFTTKSGGMGMGLHICRTLIEGMGGSISAGNRPQGGATFTFTLPQAQD